MNVGEGLRLLTSDHFYDFGLYPLNSFDFHFWWSERENQQIKSFPPFFFFLVCEHEKPEELGNILLIYFIFNKFITIINLEST